MILLEISTYVKLKFSYFVNLSLLSSSSSVGKIHDYVLILSKEVDGPRSGRLIFLVTIKFIGLGLKWNP